MTRDTRIQAIAGCVLALCLASSAVLAVNLSSLAGRAKLTYTDRAEEGQPAAVALGIAMGAFRGIFVNFLWMRANDMKEAGKFYEAIELSTAITRLQPRFPRVWVFHAWNLAYNISVTTQTREERWAWVNAGISLLRDKAIPANPNDMLIHKELGWIFLHKIGGYTDDANTYYKAQLATEWTIILGPPPPRVADDRDRELAIKRHADWLRVIADAPASIDGVIAAEPTVAVLVARLNSELGLDVVNAGGDPRKRVLGLYERQHALAKSTRREMFEKTYEQRFGHPMSPELIAAAGIVEDPGAQKAWDALLPHLRRRLLVETYHMEPGRMVRYTEKYGPIDWRHHAAHSLYWAARGVEVGTMRAEMRNRSDFDFVNTDRIVVQSVQDLYRSGEMYFDFFNAVTGKPAFLQGVPSPHFVQTYGDILEEMRDRSDFDKFSARYTTPLSGGYENFLRDAITFFYRRGQIDLAEYWRNRLATYKGINLHDPNYKFILALPINEFVQHELNDRFSSPSIAVAQVAGALMGAYTSGLLAGNNELFFKQFEFAKNAHRFYFEQQARTTAVNRESYRMEQMPRDFPLMAGMLFFQFMTALDLEAAEQMYDRAPNDLKCYAYEKMIERFQFQLDEEAKLGGRPFDVVFPKPLDFEAFRKELEEKANASPTQPSNIERQ